MQWRHSVYKNPLPYFIVLASSVKTKEVEGIEFRGILNNDDCLNGCFLNKYICDNRLFKTTYQLLNNVLNHITISNRNVNAGIMDD